MSVHLDVTPDDMPTTAAIRFTLADFERANDAWGANCGPGALAICGLTLDEVRRHFGPSWPGYTNPTAMFAALRSVLGDLSERWPPLRLVPDRIVGARYQIPTAAHVQVPWPRWGLCQIQWEEPWMQPDMPMRARYRYTHWICAARLWRPKVDGVFDINSLSWTVDGSGWTALSTWADCIVPSITTRIPRATGGWHITHAIEVQR